jgi:hypothetical protein
MSNLKSIFTLVLLFAPVGAGAATQHYSSCQNSARGQTREQFAKQCIKCQDEALKIGRSVGGFCPSDCADVYSEEVCDSKGRCRPGR